MKLAERIASRVAELTSEVELPRKQLDDAEHELEPLVIAGQAIAQLTADDAAAVGEPGRRRAGAAGLRAAGAPRRLASGRPAST
jgi:hypothetical protein